MKHIFTAIAFLTAFSLPVSAQDFLKGFVAYDAGDYAAALKEWKPLAEAGGTAAQIYLGHMYYKGHGVPQDYAEAVTWYRLAAEQGDASAQNNLGIAYYNGQGVLQDFAEAVKWFRLAADQGVASPQNNLGQMYEYGKGVFQDNVMAHMWYNIAAANGYSKAGEYRDKRAVLMTSAAIEKAQAMARECMSSGYTKCGW